MATSRSTRIPTLRALSIIIPEIEVLQHELFKAPTLSHMLRFAIISTRRGRTIFLVDIPAVAVEDNRHLRHVGLTRTCEFLYKLEQFALA